MPGSHFPFGPVVPARPVKGWPVKTHRNEATDLASLLRGRVSALQFMFTGCSATCPIQGALFAQAQRELKLGSTAAQFVSISIDPLSDSPAALDAWLRKFGARPGWLAAAPRVEDVSAIVELLGTGGEPRQLGADAHTAQVYIVDRRGDLVYRLSSMPPAAEIASEMRIVAERG
jgi:protein SCO1